MKYITEDFSGTEMLGLTNQIRRSAVSTPSNIAEGSARQSKKKFIRFLYIALGNTTELETPLFIITTDLNYLPEELEIFQKLERIRKMLLITDHG